MMIRRCLQAWVAVTLVAVCLPCVASAQRLVFLVRHAERADGGGMQMQTDPPLSAAGEARAAKLAALLGDAGIQAIYVTEFRRTQDTAKPLASKLGLEARKYSSKSSEELVRALRSEHRKDIVLVVGHSNTLPVLIKALGGPAVTIGESEYDSMFLIVPETGTMTRIRFTP
jgi:broad specificity phosphatase PhoE